MARLPRIEFAGALITSPLGAIGARRSTKTTRTEKRFSALWKRWSSGSTGVARPIVWWPTTAYVKFRVMWCAGLGGSNSAH